MKTKKPTKAQLQAQAKARTLQIASNRTFDINWDNVTKIEDIKLLLKGLGLQVNIQGDTIPELQQPLFDADLLVERKLKTINPKN